MIKEDPNMPASDCSGMEIGYMREHKLIKPTSKEIAINLENYSVIKDNYDRFKELLTIGEDEKVLIEICTCEDISMEKAKEIVKHLKLSYKS